MLMISMNRPVIAFTGKYFIAYLAPEKDKHITNNGTNIPIFVASYIRLLTLPSINE